jgi:hypothetical protein
VPPVAQIERRPLQAHGRQAVIEEYMDRRRRTRGPGTGTPVSARAETAGHRGKNGKDERSFAFAQAFGRATDSAQPCRLSERQRTGANGCTKSTSWGSLVRAQYRPSKGPAQGPFLLRERATVGKARSCHGVRSNHGRAFPSGAEPLLTSNSAARARDRAPRMLFGGHLSIAISSPSSRARSRLTVLCRSAGHGG